MSTIKASKRISEGLDASWKVIALILGACISAASANIRSASSNKGMIHRATSESSLMFNVPDPPIRTSRMTSHFEQLWPGYQLPSWARKSLNFDVPRNQSTCFIHVGKAGGSAIGCSLGFSLHCAESSQVEGVLPKITTTIFHKDVYDCNDDDSHYLLVIRDPIERARSAFNYDRPDEDDNSTESRYIQYYHDCSFRTIEEMVQNGLSSHGDSSEHCKSLASRAIRGTTYIAPSHLYYNYQYYFESIPEQSPIIVIRNEYLEEDWNALEEKMSGRNDVMNDESMPTLNVNMQINQEDLYISDESLEILCEALCNEIQVYKKILSLAQNLNEDQVYSSFDALALKCPTQARTDECPEAMPDIKRKIKMNRGYGEGDEEETME